MQWSVIMKFRQNMMLDNGISLHCIAIENAGVDSVKQIGLIKLKWVTIEINI